MIEIPQFPTEQIPPKESTLKIIALFVTIGMVLVIGIGRVLPMLISMTDDLAKVPQDKVRQAFSSDYLDPSAKIVNGTPFTAIVWQPKPPESFSVVENPIFQEYGYNWDFMFRQRGMDILKAFPNASSSLYAAQTAGIDYSDMTKGYPISSMLIFNKDLSFFKEMPLPKQTDGCCNAVVAWLGNRYLLVNEFIPGIFPPGAGNYFYIGDTSSSTAHRTFESIRTPDDLSNKHYMNVSMFSHPDRNLAVISYCLSEVQMDTYSYCTQYGISIATPQRIVELLKKNTQDSFKTGWDEDNLYVQESDQKTGISTTYAFPLSTYKNDSYIDIFEQNRDPASQGTPAWIKSWIPIKEKVNFISFDLSFIATTTYSAYSRGLLTIRLNDRLVGEAYEEQETSRTHKKIFFFTRPPIGTSTLEIRIDPLNPYAHSEMDIKNFGFGFATSTSMR